MQALGKQLNNQDKKAVVKNLETPGCKFPTKAFTKFDWNYSQTKTQLNPLKE